MSEQQQINLENMSVDEVLELIENGEITPEEALKIEAEGKNRKTLVGTLDKMIESTNMSEQEKPVKVKGVIVANVKHNKDRYQAGQRVELPQEDYDVLLAAKVIRPIEE
jgi:mannose/fructose/N-acetylgalactosamine-specific phosphotransferase system component IIB